MFSVRRIDRNRKMFYPLPCPQIKVAMREVLRALPPARGEQIAGPRALQGN